VTHPLNAYAALGGHPGLRRAVEHFAELVLGDPTVAGHFRAMDPEAWRWHQLEVLAAAVGGPQRNSVASHVGPPWSERLTEAEFNRVLGHLGAALSEVGADEGAIRDVIEAASQTRDLVVIAPETSHSHVHLERTQS
jgi:hemoglobin